MKRILTFIVLTALIASALICNVSAAVVEDNDGNVWFSDAQAVALGDEIHGTIKNLLDRDIFKFEVTETGKLEMNFTHGTLLSNDARWVIRLYDANLSEISNQYFYADTAAGYPATILTPGTYYVMVNNGHTLTCGVANVNYVLKLGYTVFTDWEQEKNDTENTATEMEIGKEYAGALSDGSDEDWFSFDLEERSDVTLRFLHNELDEGNDWSLTVYDENGIALYDEILEGDVSESEIKLNGLAEGKYFVCVKNGNGEVVDVTYALTVDAVKSERPDLFCDINMDGSVDAFDYMLVKAFVMGADDIDPSFIARMNVNGDDAIDAFDYMIVKSVVLGTYNVK